MTAGDTGRPQQRPEQPDDGNRWAAHPHWARLLRLAIRLSPVAVAAVVSWQLGAHLPSPHGHHRWLIVATIVAASLLAGLLTERLARRLLPLTMLLTLTMLFPDRAPSRWKIARQASRAVDIAAGRPGTTQADLAERSLALLAALTAHDRRTRGHSERVRVFAEMLGAELHLNRDEADRLRWAALLHDVGKLEVSAALLNKAGKPTSGEWLSLRMHPETGARLAGPLLPWLGEWGLGIGEHHEKVDGTGYPRGLRGNDISRAGRALAVVDAYEVMTAARSYKRPMNVGKARLELATCAGSHFDETMVRAFLAISLPRLLWTTGPLAFLANLPFLAGLQAASRVIPAVANPGAAAVGVLAAGAVVAAVPAYAAPTTPATKAPTTWSAPTDAAASPTQNGASATEQTGPTGPTGPTGRDSSPTSTTPVLPGATAPAGTGANGGSALPPTATAPTGMDPTTPPAAPPTGGTAAPPTVTVPDPGSSLPAPPPTVAGPPVAPPPVAVPPVAAPPVAVPPIAVPPVNLPPVIGPPAVSYAITFLTVPAAHGASRSAVLGFDSPAGTRYAYRLDGGRWQTTTVAVGTLAEVAYLQTGGGVHTFQAYAVDGDGIALGPVASYRWTAGGPS